MKQGPKFLIGVIPVLLAAALIALAAGAASGNFGSTPLPPKSTPSPPTHIPEPRSTQDTVTDEERDEVKRRRAYSSQEWGPHTAGTVIEIAGRQVQLPTDVYVEGIVDHVLCVEGESCPNTPIYGLRRGDSRVGIEEHTGQFVPGSSDSDLAAFDFIQEALRCAQGTR